MAATLRLYNHQPSLHPIRSTKMVPLVNPCSSTGNISAPGRVPVALWGLVWANRVKFMTPVSSPIPPPLPLLRLGGVQGSHRGLNSSRQLQVHISAPSFGCLQTVVRSSEE